MAFDWASITGNKKFMQFAGEAAQDLGYGLANATNVGNAFGEAARYGSQMQPFRQQQRLQEQQLAEKAEERNQTTEWIKANYPQYANLPPAEGFKLASQQAALDSKIAGGMGSSAPSNVQEWQYYSGLSPEEQSQYLTMKRSNSPLNIGTGFVTQDMANPGQILGGPIAIENRQEAYDTGYGAVEGRADAESAALAESIQSKMPGLRTVIDDLTALADTATYTQSGQAMDAVKRELGLPVGQGAIDRSSYIAIVDNQVLPLLRDTFGAAFTQKEGESLRATLGDPNKSPAEKKAILNAFIAQKERDVAGMQSRAAGQGGGQNFVYNPATRKLEPQ